MVDVKNKLLHDLKKISEAIEQLIKDLDSTGMEIIKKGVDMTQKFGCFKSPKDTRDFLISSFLEPTTLPKSFDRTEEMTPVRSQGNEGACVGFAMTVGVKEWQEKKDYSRFISLSPRFLYEEAKKVSGHTEGTTLRAAMEVALKLGVCEENYWPYVAQNIGKPQDGAYENALKFKISTYAKITNLDELKQAIIDPKIGTVLIGVNVYKGMMSESCKKTGVVPNPLCFDRFNVLGGHALCAVGYTDISPYFKDGHVKVKNSWGDYGDKGYLYLSYKYLQNNLLDAYSSVDIDDPNEYAIMTVKDMKRKRGLWI